MKNKTKINITVDGPITTDELVKSLQDKFSTAIDSMVSGCNIEFEIECDGCDKNPIINTSKYDIYTLQDIIYGISKISCRNKRAIRSTAKNAEDKDMIIRLENPSYRLDEILDILSDKLSIDRKYLTPSDGKGIVIVKCNPDAVDVGINANLILSALGDINRNYADCIFEYYNIDSSPDVFGDNENFIVQTKIYYTIQELVDCLISSTDIKNPEIAAANLAINISSDIIKYNKNIISDQIENININVLNTGAYFIPSVDRVVKDILRGKYRKGECVELYEDHMRNDGKDYYTISLKAGVISFSGLIDALRDEYPKEMSMYKWHLY